MTVQQTIAVLQRFPQGSLVLVQVKGVDQPIAGVEMILPTHLPVDLQKNIGWSDLITEAIQVRIVVATSVVPESPERV